MGGVRCPGADHLRLAWYGADTQDERNKRHAALQEHVKGCATCRAELARDDNGPAMPEYGQAVKELERMEK